MTATRGGGGEDLIHFLEVPTGKPLGSLPLLGLPTELNFAALSPDGRTILTGGLRKAQLWDAVTGRAVGLPMRQEATIVAAAFSPDGATVLTAGETGGRLWDAATGAAISHPTFPHPKGALSVAFSPDGRLVLTGGNDDTARLWDAASGKLLAPPLPHHGFVHWVAFAHGGEDMWTASWDGTIRCWKVPSPVQGDPERIVLWMQVLTCMELGPDGSTHELDAEQWNDRRRQLELLGGPPAP